MLAGAAPMSFYGENERETRRDTESAPKVETVGQPIETVRAHSEDESRDVLCLVCAGTRRMSGGSPRVG